MSKVTETARIYRDTQINNNYHLPLKLGHVTEARYNLSLLDINVKILHCNCQFVKEKKNQNKTTRNNSRVCLNLSGRGEACTSDFRMPFTLANGPFSFFKNLSFLKIETHGGQFARSQLKEAYTFHLWCKEIWKRQIHKSKIILWYNF